MRMFRQGLITTSLLFFAATVFAQGSQYDTDKFRQLEEILPTPNTYRTASGAPGHEYWLGAELTRMDLKSSSDHRKGRRKNCTWRDRFRSHDARC